MTNTTTATTARRRRAGALSPHERLFADTAPMRRTAVWSKARWVPDADAAVDAAVWEAIHSGVTTWQTLFDVARAAAVAQRRYELRQHRHPPMCTPEPIDPAERAVEITEAKRQVGHLLSTMPPTSPGVTTWLDRTLGVTYGDPLPSRVKTAGSRWAARARSELEACNDVA